MTLLFNFSSVFLVLGDFLYIYCLQYKLNCLYDYKQQSKETKIKKKTQQEFVGRRNREMYLMFPPKAKRITLSCTLISFSPPSSFFPDHHLVHIVTYQSSTKTSGLFSQPSHTLGYFLPLLEDLLEDTELQLSFLLLCAYYSP